MGCRIWLGGPCTIAAGFNVGAYLGLGVDLGAGVDGQRLQAIEAAMCTDGRQPYGKPGHRPAQDSAGTRLDEPVHEERQRCRAQCSANPVKHMGRESDGLLGPGYPNTDVQPNAYPRFNGDMGFKVVGPPRVHMHETSATCGRVVDPARANSIYRGSEVETSDALGYGGCTALLSPVVLRSDSCAAGFAAFAVGLATNMFPRMEPTVDCLKSMSDATRAKDHSTRAAALKAAGCTMMSDDDTETLNRLRAYRVALNFGYKVFLIHKMYAEDMLGHVGEVKRSEYNVAQCQSKRSDVNAKTYGTLNQMRCWRLQTSKSGSTAWAPRSLVPNVGQWPLASKLPKDRQMMAWAQRRTIALTGCATQGQATVLRATRTIPVLHEPHSKSLYFRLLCQVPEAHDMGLCAMQAPRNFHTTIVRTAQEWYRYVDLNLRSKGAGTDVAGLENVLYSGSFCQLITTRIIEGLYNATRTEMELRIGDLEQPVRYGLTMDSPVPELVPATDRIKALELVCQDMGRRLEGIDGSNAGSLQRACEAEVRALGLKGLYRADVAGNFGGIVGGHAPLHQMLVPYRAAIQSFRKQDVVLLQSTARHGKEITTLAHRSLYQLTHSSLTSGMPVERNPASPRLFAMS